MALDFKYIKMEARPELGIATIILSRPEKHNALNEAAQVELSKVLDLCAQDCRVVIITGAGERAFCTGIDLKELSAQQNKSQSSLESDTWLNISMKIVEHPAIFIAAVNGYAFGGGLTLVNVADIAVAAENATFAMPEVGFGSFPRLAAPSAMRRIAPKHVSWMALTAKRVDAATAREWGLVNEVVVANELEAYVSSLATDIAKFDPNVLTWTKRGLGAIEPLNLRNSLEFGSYVRAMIMKERNNS